MSRVRIPLIVLGPDGRPLPGALATVHNRATGTTVPVYAAETGATTLSAGAIISDTGGRVPGWTTRGALEATITPPSGSPLAPYVVAWEALPAGDAAGEDGWVPDHLITARMVLGAEIVTKDGAGNIQQPGSLNAVGGFYCERGSGGTSGGVHLRQGGDPYWRVIAWTDGRISWGDGTNPHDTTLTRPAPNVLRAGAALQSDADVNARIGSATQTSIGDVGGQPGIQFGAFANLYAFTNVIKTDVLLRSSTLVEGSGDGSARASIGDVQGNGLPGLGLGTSGDAAIVRDAFGPHVSVRSASTVFFANSDHSAWQDIEYRNPIAHSDENAKTNVEVIDDPITQIRQISGYRFEFIASGDLSLGVIAQEVAGPFPELVHTMGEGTDAEGLGVNYNGLHAVQIESIKLLADRCDTLEERLAALEAAAA